MVPPFLAPCTLNMKKLSIGILKYLSKAIALGGKPRKFNETLGKIKRTGNIAKW